MTDHEGDRRSPNGWSRYEELVLSELRRLCEDLETVGNKLEEVRTRDLPQIRVDVARDLATMKTEVKFKSGLWGLLAGAIPVTIGIVYLLFQAKAGHP